MHGEFGHLLISLAFIYDYNDDSKMVIFFQGPTCSLLMPAGVASARLSTCSPPGAGDLKSLLGGSTMPTVTRPVTSIYSSNCIFPFIVHLAPPFCDTLLCDGHSMTFLTEPHDGPQGAIQPRAFTENAALGSPSQPSPFLEVLARSRLNRLCLPRGHQGPGLGGCFCCSRILHPPQPWV